MRRAMLVLAACLLAGCAARPARPAGPAVALAVAFADGFHSGVILDRSLVPSRLLPAGPATIGCGWVVVHFGERRWILGEADSCWDGVRLGLAGGNGGVEVDVIPWWVHARGGTDREHERIWAFPLTRSELDGLLARLDAWLGPPGDGGQIGPVTCWWPATRAWTLGRNCHDFTADLLAGAGIRVDPGAIAVAPAMRSALDRAWEEREGPR